MRQLLTGAQSKVNLVFIAQAACFVLILSCSDVPPPPTYPEDLGTEDRPLLPPPGALHDPTVLKGSAEWRAFRKPEAAGKDQPESKPSDNAEDSVAKATENAAAIVKEIEGLLSDYNGLLSEGKVTEAIEFFLPEQAKAAQALGEILPKVAAKIGALAASFPDQPELAALAKRLEPAAALKLETTAIRAAGPQEATATLSALPPFSILPGAPPVAEISKEIRFVVGEDDVWFIDWPLLLAVVKDADQIEGRLAQWDALIGDAKSGKLAAADLKEKAPEIAGVLGSTPPADASKAAEDKEGS